MTWKVLSQEKLMQMWNAKKNAHVKYESPIYIVVQKIWPKLKFLCTGLRRQLSGLCPGKWTSVIANGLTYFLYGNNGIKSITRDKDCKRFYVDEIWSPLLALHNEYWFLEMHHYLKFI